MNTCIHPQKESVCSSLAVDAADFGGGTVAISVAVAVAIQLSFFCAVVSFGKGFCRLFSKRDGKNEMALRCCYL